MIRMIFVIYELRAIINVKEFWMYSRLNTYCVQGAYTGTMVGMCCNDMLYRKTYADFEYFTYTDGEQL